MVSLFLRALFTVTFSFSSWLILLLNAITEAEETQNSLFGQHAFISAELIRNA